MARPLITLLESLRDKISELDAAQDVLLGRLEKLKEENDALRRDLAEKDRLLEKANSDIEFLTVSHRLAESPDSLVATRRRIARLIRTVDNCISMIKDE